MHSCSLNIASSAFTAQCAVGGVPHHSLSSAVCKRCEGVALAHLQRT